MNNQNTGNISPDYRAAASGNQGPEMQARAIDWTGKVSDLSHRSHKTARKKVKGYAVPK